MAVSEHFVYICLEFKILLEQSDDLKQNQPLKLTYVGFGTAAGSDATVPVILTMC